MTQSLLSVHSGADAGDAPITEEQMQQFFQAVQDLEAEMKAAGAWLFGGRLHDPETATVVRIVVHHASSGTSRRMVMITFSTPRTYRRPQCAPRQSRRVRMNV